MRKNKSNIQPVLLFDFEPTIGIDSVEHLPLYKNLASVDASFKDKAEEMGIRFSEMCNAARHSLYKDNKIANIREFSHENLFFSNRLNKYVVILSNGNG